MVSPLTKVEPVDLASLAALANAKLAPATPYAFTAIAAPNEIELPEDIIAEATYGPAGQFLDGATITLRLYAYKTIGGVKKFTGVFVRKAFTGIPGGGTFSMQWTWPAALGPTAPDGYIVAIVYPFTPTTLAWLDTGVTLLTEDGSFSSPVWKFDKTLDANNEGNPAQNLPCGRGSWLKTLNTIWPDLFAKFDLFGGATALADNHKVSGPWIVSAGPKCYLYLGAPASRRPLYKNLAFLYSEAESATGNQLAREADIFATLVGVVNNANTFNWDANVKINGRIAFFSDPPFQSAADWHLTASHPGITITFDPGYSDGRFLGLPRPITGLLFDFKDVQYTVGTPVILTCTPLAGASVLGSAAFDCIFTSDPFDYSTADTTAIHPGSGAIAPGAAKAAALPSTLTAITLSTGLGGVAVLETHYRAFCDGVYQANTLPTPGVFPYVDVDLPQYRSDTAASSRREARNLALRYEALVDNLACLYPIARDTDYAPDLVAGRPLNGSFAWQQFLATKYVETASFTDPMPPYLPGNTLQFYAQFVKDTAVDARFRVGNPALTLIGKAGAFPTITNFDIAGAGGAWLSLKDLLPGFATNTTWFIGIYNPTAAAIEATFTATTITSASAPTGTFFATQLDIDGNVVPRIEGYSYHPAPVNRFEPANPIPLRGYCIYKITCRRKPVVNAGGIAVSPSTGTADLPVKIGLMKDFSFDSQGVFQELLTITIPAGQASISADVFLPVLKGWPLAYQCAEITIVLAAVNYQPLMHSSFFGDTSASVINPNHDTGRHDGPPWDFSARCLLFFVTGDLSQPILLPIAAAVYNDLVALLGLL